MPDRSDEQVIEAAARVMANDCIKSGRFFDNKNHSGGRHMAEARALHTAGMLASPLHRRALEACERLERDRMASPTGAIHDDYARPVRACMTVGAESLAAKEPPKPRWEARKSSLSSGEWFVEPNNGQSILRIGSPGLNEREARACAAALNALDAERSHADTGETLSPHNRPEGQKGTPDA